MNYFILISDKNRRSGFRAKAHAQIRFANKTVSTLDFNVLALFLFEC